MGSGKLIEKIFRHRQPIAWTLAALWALFIFILSSMPGSIIPSQVQPWTSFLHFCEYWILGVLIIGALDMPWRRSWMTAVAAMLLAALYGATDEFHQLFVIGRCCDVIDWLVDTSGGVVGALAGTWFLTIYRLFTRRPQRGVDGTLEYEDRN